MTENTPAKLDTIIVCKISHPIWTPLFMVGGVLFGLMMVGSWLAIPNSIGYAATFAFSAALTVWCFKFAWIAAREPAQVNLSLLNMRFGDYWKYTLRERQTRDWADLHCVEYNGELKARDIADWMAMSNSSLTFDFKSGGSAVIPFNGLERTDVESLFLALEKYSDQSVLSRRALLFERTLMSTDDEALLECSTVWTDEIEAQFAATQFVPLQTGTRLLNDRYEVRMQLASTGLSAVYLCKEEGKGKVVLKESVTPAGVDDKSRGKAKELFEREARLLARVDHPNIARVLDHFVENGRDYIVLQFIPGITLRQLRFKDGTLPVEQITRWGIQIAEILDYLHRLEPPIIHRDLTPDNLLLREDNNVALIDFGVSNEFVGQATGTLVGKQAYIPVEQFRGKAELKSDIYAFGATLFFLLTGEDPEPLSVSHPKEKRAELSTELDILIAQCTSMEAADRPDAAAVLASLRALATDRSSIANGDPK